MTILRSRDHKNTRIFSKSTRPTFKKKRGLGTRLHILSQCPTLVHYLDNFIAYGPLGQALYEVVNQVAWAGMSWALIPRDACTKHYEVNHSRFTTLM